jgi:VIT1/CCC1 family predicted Fe2+/Mn2+ transporter
LGSIFGIVSGVTGATLGDQRFVLVAGLSGVLASAVSAGTGAYLAAKGDREIYEAGVAREREAIAGNRGEAQELLSMYLQMKGLPGEDADAIVQHISKNPHQLLRVLSTYRLNATEDALDDPFSSGFLSAIATAIGAFIPVVPFLFFGGDRAFAWAAGVSLLAHFAIGASKSLITVRSWWSGGLELCLVGALEGALTYAVGVAIGHFAS